MSTTEISFPMGEAIGVYPVTIDWRDNIGDATGITFVESISVEEFNAKFSELLNSGQAVTEEQLHTALRGAGLKFRYEEFPK